MPVHGRASCLNNITDFDLRSTGVRSSFGYGYHVEVAHYHKRKGAFA
jgi:hypothetical protein